MTSSSYSSPALAGYIELLEQSRKPFTGLGAADLLCAELGALLAVPCAKESLRRALRAALQAGLAVQRIDSVLLHLAPYAGLGPVERAQSVLDALVASDSAGAQAARLRLDAVPAERAQRIERGFLHYRNFHADRPERQAPRYAPLSPDYYPGGMELMSHTFADTGLGLREREIASIACLAALGCCPDQLRFHLEVGLREGVTQAHLAGVLLLVQMHAGVPRAHNAAAIAAQLLAARGT
jgi:4-carboxymuconolactone decarboxylase